MTGERREVLLSPRPLVPRAILYTPSEQRPIPLRRYTLKFIEDSCHRCHRKLGSPLSDSPLLMNLHDRCFQLRSAIQYAVARHARQRYPFEHSGLGQDVDAYLASYTSRCPPVSFLGWMLTVAVN